MKDIALLKRKKAIAALLTAAAIATPLAACTSDADLASKNLSKAAEQFEINRRIVAIDTISNVYIFEVTGKCSVEFPDNRLEVVCKLENGTYAKHFVHLSDNVTVVAEQTNGTAVDTDQYRVIFKPEVILPNVDRP